MPTVNIKQVAGGVVAVVNTTKGPVEGKPCTTIGFALKSLRAVTKAMGKELPPTKALTIINPATNPEPDFEFTDFAPAIESEEAPATERTPISEPEPELHRALRQVEGTISPIDQPERWVAIWKGVVARYGSADPELILTAMKGMNCASPYERDSEGRPFHMYADNSLVRTPRPGEGERRQLRNANGYNRDFMGRTPVEPGSVARDTDPHHPANKPERAKRMSRADRMAANKAAKAELRASDPAGFEVQTWASKLAGQASKAMGGDTVAYKMAFVATAQVLGGLHIPKAQKFAADLKIENLNHKPDMLCRGVELLVANNAPVSPEWIAWAKEAREAIGGLPSIKAA